MMERKGLLLLLPVFCASVSASLLSKTAIQFISDRPFICSRLQSPADERKNQHLTFGVTHALPTIGSQVPIVRLTRHRRNSRLHHKPERPEVRDSWTTQFTVRTHAVPPTLMPVAATLPAFSSKGRISVDTRNASNWDQAVTEKDTITDFKSNDPHSRSKRQMYTRGFENSLLGSFASTFPVFSSNFLTEAMLSGSLAGLFDGGRYGQESKVHHQVSALSPSSSFVPGPTTAASFSNSIDHFPNPFPTVPMDHFDFDAFKSASEEDAIFGGKGNFVGTAFPPMNFNPQTGTFYEPVFGSHIPASLMGDFTPLHPMTKNKMRFPQQASQSHPPGAIIGPMFDNSTRLPLPISPSAKSKLVAYEYMYKPFSMFRSPGKRPPLREKIPMSTTQISYEKVNLPPLRDTLPIPTPKPTYKQDSSPSPVKSPPVTWYKPDPKDMQNKPTRGFHGVFSEPMIPKPLFTHETFVSNKKNIPVSPNSMKQHSNFVYKPLFSSKTVKESYTARDTSFTPNQLKPHVVYATQSEPPMKQFKGVQQPFDHETSVPYKAPAFATKTIPKIEKSSNSVTPATTYGNNRHEKTRIVEDSDPWKYVSVTPQVPEIPRPVFVPAVKTYTSPPFRKHRPFFPEPTNSRYEEHKDQRTTSDSTSNRPDRIKDQVRDSSPESEHAPTTPVYGQKLHSKLTASTARNKITPPQVVKSATYHQTARPPYTRPYPVTSTSPPPTTSTAATRGGHHYPHSFVNTYETRDHELDRFRYHSGSQNIPNSQPEPEDDSQEYTIVTPKLQSHADVSSTTTTTTTTESSENERMRGVTDFGVDYVDNESKADMDRSNEATKSVSYAGRIPVRGEGESGDPLVDEMEEVEEMEQTIQTPPKVTEKNDASDEPKKTINLFKKRPDYTKLYSKYAKSPAPSTTTTPATTTSTTRVPFTTSTTTTSTRVEYDSNEDQDTVTQSNSPFGSRLSHSSRSPVVSIKTSTSTKSMKPYPYSPKGVTRSHKNKSQERQSTFGEKSEAASDEDVTHIHSSTASPSLRYSSFNRFRHRLSSTTTTTTRRPTVSTTASTTTVEPWMETSTPNLFVGKLGNLQDLGIFDSEDPDEEEAIDVPVISRQDAEESSTSSSTADAGSIFRKVYSSSAGGALNARLTGQRVTKSAMGQKSVGYLSSFFKHLPLTPESAQDAS